MPEIFERCLVEPAARVRYLGACVALTRWPGVTVRIDPPRHVVPFAGALDVDPGTGGTAFEHSFTTGRRAKLGEWRRIHVMSAHAGGEIRGYELEVGGELLLAYPCYTGIWPEMDAEVARIVAAAALT